jgi:hypothetical protein
MLRRSVGRRERENEKSEEEGDHVYLLLLHNPSFFLFFLCDRSETKGSFVEARMRLNRIWNGRQAKEEGGIIVAYYCECALPYTANQLLQGAASNKKTIHHPPFLPNCQKGRDGSYRPGITYHIQLAQLIAKNASGVASGLDCSLRVFFFSFFGKVELWYWSLGEDGCGGGGGSRGRTRSGGVSEEAPSTYSNSTRWQEPEPGGSAIFAT